MIFRCLIQPAPVLLHLLALALQLYVLLSLAGNPHLPQMDFCRWYTLEPQCGTACAFCLTMLPSLSFLYNRGQKGWKRRHFCYITQTFLTVGFVAVRSVIRDVSAQVRTKGNPLLNLASYLPLRTITIPWHSQSTKLPNIRAVLETDTLGSLKTVF